MSATVTTAIERELLGKLERSREKAHRLWQAGASTRLLLATMEVSGAEKRIVERIEKILSTAMDHE